MDLHQLLDHLDHHHVRLHVGAGRLHLIGPARIATDPEVGAAITEHKTLLMAHIIGTRTGHTIGFCTTCNAAVITHYRPSGKAPTCRLTPGCDGRHQPRPADVSRLAAIGAPSAPKQAAPPRRPATKFLLGSRPPWPSTLDSTTTKAQR